MSKLKQRLEFPDITKSTMGEGKILPGSIQLQTQFLMIPYGHTAIINAKKSITKF